MSESSNEIVATPKKKGRKKKEVVEEVKHDSLGLVVEMPISEVDVDKLQNLLIAKERLIKKSLSVDDLKIEVNESVVIFPWFKEDTSPDDMMVYTRFISVLCKMSKDSSRINPKQKDIENEKYAFRCFLLRLGYIGNDYKEDRKILLRNFTGSSAFKTKKVGE